ENDLRLDKYFAETDEKGFRKNKKAGSNNYLCTFRVGEIYLTAAEAAARLGELSQARTRLLELMRKRYAPEAYEAKSVVVNAMDKEALVQEILDERARELAFEGHRWFDLRRTTRPEIKKEIEDVTYTLVQDDSRYTLRIPQDAIDANPGLLN
ncbi:MAG: RagB/SusD family nutrient uptake outer membrane protein, partial [Bacteroides sp.]|nr:RagB/SusD family nutrient uptake outer membrane protein [Bacteroides sp.]